MTAGSGRRAVRVLLDLLVPQALLARRGTLARRAIEARRVRLGLRVRSARRVPVARLSLALVYWLAKERGDLTRRGSLIDGIGDTAWVAVGLGYAGPWWWPMAVLTAVIAGAVLRQWTIERGRNA
ncbi:hypothetical protein ACEYYA_00980 [Paracoccus sp. p3-h83]|uniref:hypothetical protein n=1 Tax=Paracoccus sp. p3-h83 TaxID=3342805 RepID=UPI0035BB4C32